MRIITKQLTNHKDLLSPSSYTKCCSDNQEIIRNLRNPNARYLFAGAHHRSLPWAGWIQSTSSQRISLDSNLHLHLPSNSFPSEFPISTPFANFSSLRVTCPLNLVFLDQYREEKYKL
jgi:hypothetical protein